MSRWHLAGLARIISVVWGLLLLGVVVFPAPGVGMEPTHGKESAPLRMAFTPPRDLYQALDRFQPFLAVLGDQVGLRLRFQWVESRHRLLLDMAQDHIDLAVVDGVTYLFGTHVLRWRQLGTVRSKGKCRRTVSLIVRNDSTISSLVDLAGQRYGISDPLEVGNLWMDMLLEQWEVDASHFFGRIVRTASGASGILDVIVGRIDVTVADHQTFLSMSQENAHQGKIKELAISPSFANCVLVVRPGIDAATRDRLVRSLMNLETTLQGAAVLAAAGIDGFDRQPDSFFATEQWLLTYFRNRVRRLDDTSFLGN